MTNLLFLIASFALSNAQVASKQRLELRCEATEIIESEFQEAFSVEEYPEVYIYAVEETEPFMPAIRTSYQLKIGANSAYVRGVNNVKTVRRQQTGDEKKFVVTFNDGSTITLTVGYNGQGTLESSDETLKAKVSCR